MEPTAPRYQSLVAFTARVVLFFAGLLIVYWQNVKGGPADVPLLFLAAGFIGPLAFGTTLDVASILRGALGVTEGKK
jgi:hypothetical protein